MNLIFFIISNILFIFLLNKILLKKDFLVDKKKLKHKHFISREPVPISGGFLILLNLFFLNNNYLENFFYFAIFFLGIFSDLFIIKSALKKFLIQFIIVLLFVIFLKITILSTKVFFIDFLIQNKLFSLLFTCFCLLILINGSNFLDGINTLVCGYYILIILVILYIGYYNIIYYNFLEFYYLLLILLIIFLFNFFSKTYLGDSGTFLLSLLVGYYLINLCNNNLSLYKYISPIFILLLLWYPAFENLFSIIRKILSKVNPSQADNQHLHHLLFSFLNKKIYNKKIANSFTALVINFYNFLIFIVAAKFYNQSSLLTLLIIFNICIYIFTYLFLIKKNNSN